MKNSTLTIAQSEDRYDSLLEQIEKDSKTIVELNNQVQLMQLNTFKHSIVLERQKGLSSTLALHLSKFLDEFEAKFDSDEQCDSCEIALDYIEAAKFMKLNFKRVGDRINDAQHWFDNQPLNF